MSLRTSGRSAGKRPVRRHFLYKTGLCEGTTIQTQQGDLPVEYLSAGDRVMTRQGMRTVRHITSRILKDCPIQVRRDALGPNRPAQDMYLAPDQGVHLQDWRALRYFGSDQPSVPVSRLHDGERILWGEHPGDLTVYELEFSEEQIIYAEGMEVMSAPAPATPVSSA